MVITKTDKKTSKIQKTKVSKKETVFGAIEKKTSTNPDTSVSIFTKTTNPKVVIQAEKIDVPHTIQNIHRHRIIKSACLIVMGIIILMTFFLSLKTYQTVNELYQLFTF